MSEKLQASLSNGYEVKIGDYISRGFEIMKKYMGGYIGFTVIYFMISAVATYIPFSSIIIGPLLIFGFHLVSNQISQKGTVPEFGKFFGGFSLAGKLIVIALISALIYLVCLLPFIFTVGVSIFSLIGSNDTSAILAVLASGASVLGICMIFVTYFSVSWMFAPLISVFHNMEAWQSLETSRKLVGKQWFMLFLFVIVVGIISVSGVILLGFGLLFTIPLGICCLYAAFEDICGLEKNKDSEVDQISQIGNSLS